MQRAASRGLRNPAMTSITDFASSPETAVLPMCSTATTHGCMAASMRARSYWKSVDQRGSYGTTYTGSIAICTGTLAQP